MSSTLLPELAPTPWYLESECFGGRRARIRSHLEQGGPPLLLGLDRRDPRIVQNEAGLFAFLPEEEQQRSLRYRLPDDRARFVLGRALLRDALGAWLNRPPREVLILQGPHGKPYCPGGPEFNLSHSGSLVLMALHPCCAVGVDVERLRPELDWLPIARRVLRADEVLALQQGPPDGRSIAFHQVWCRLEAVLKAEGQGFAASPRRDPPPGVMVCSLRLPKGYVGALAALA